MLKKHSKHARIQLKVTPKMMIIVMIMLNGKFKWNRYAISWATMYASTMLKCTSADAFIQFAFPSRRKPVSAPCQMNGTAADGARQLKTWNLTLNYDLLLISLMLNINNIDNTPHPTVSFAKQTGRISSSFHRIVISLEIFSCELGH